MAELPEIFQAKDEDTMDDAFATVPPGWYTVEIIKSILKPTKANKSNKFLELTFNIMEGEFENKKLWSRLNIIHTNSQTVAIAKRELASICEALGIESVIDTEELHNQPLKVRVIEEPKTKTQPPRNRIKEYRPMDYQEASNEMDSKFDDDIPF